MKPILPVLASLSLLAAPVQADGLAGTWLTEPDHNGWTAHVVVERCGELLCGTMRRAFGENGEPITTPNVGKRILRDVKAQGNAGEGMVYVPLMRREFPVRLVANGNRLNLKACNRIGICRTQIWQRVD
ncbi:MAG: DUF2147 domain-containing protein [Rhodobacter sp.]|nr:DUF2147 domain-containing protein [Rhodobacter sp.]